MLHKTFSMAIDTKEPSGGQIRISTQDTDRDRDRVVSSGVVIDNYMKNPVVQWGHGYYEPWQTIGRTTALDIGDGEIVAAFELRPPANEQDPQHVVQLLWDGGWVRAASIGLNPIEWKENEQGGKDITRWELVEWSLVPVPSNQNALRLAAKAAEPTPHGSKSSDATEDNIPNLSALDDAEITTAVDAQLATILAEFISALRPYLAGGEK